MTHFCILIYLPYDIIPDFFLHKVWLNPYPETLSVDIKHHFKAFMWISKCIFTCEIPGFGSWMISGSQLLMKYFPLAIIIGFVTGWTWQSKKSFLRKPNQNLSKAIKTFLYSLNTTNIFLLMAVWADRSHFLVCVCGQYKLQWQGVWCTNASLKTP